MTALYKKMNLDYFNRCHFEFDPEGYEIVDTYDVTLPEGFTLARNFGGHGVISPFDHRGYEWKVVDGEKYIMLFPADDEADLELMRRDYVDELKQRGAVVYRGEIFFRLCAK